MNAPLRTKAFVALTALVTASSVGCGSVATDSADGETVSSDAGLTPPSATAPDVAVPPQSGASATSAKEQTYRPGELIVKFKSDASTGLHADFASALRQRQSLARLTADRSDSLDQWLGRHRVLDAERLLHNVDGLSPSEARTKLQARPLLPSRWRATRSTNLNPAATQGTMSPFEGLVDVYRVKLAPGADLETAMAELRNDPHVEYVHPNYVARVNYTPNDPYLASSGSYGQPRADLWNVKKVRAPTAWDTTRGAGVVVAVIDTGVDVGHPDLNGNVWTNSREASGTPGVDDDGNGFVDDAHGWSFWDDVPEVTDGPGHGTHVAGIIAAQDNNAEGIVGIAPDAKIMPLQVFSPTDQVQITDVYTLTRALVYATENGADVINNSWSLCGDGSCGSAPVVETAIREAHQAGIVVVMSSGNSASNIRNFSPQNMPEVIVVGASTPTDTRADFSNNGQIDLVAPGTGDINDPSNVGNPAAGILSLRSRECSNGAACYDGYRVTDLYSRLSGTSFAAPTVSGAAALILSLHPEYSHEQVRQALRRTATDTGPSGYDTDFGHGRLDVGSIAAQPTPLEALIQMPLLFTSNAVPIAGRAQGSQFARYTLEYGKGSTPSSWTSLYSSTTPAADGLYFWKPNAVADGEYTMRLRAYKTDGTFYEDRHGFTLDRIALTTPTESAALPSGDIQILGSASPGDFRSYTLRAQRLDSTAAFNPVITLSNNGLSPVLNGVLGVWKTQGVPAGHYKLTLEVTTTAGVVTSESAKLVVDPLTHTGFPFELPTEPERDSSWQEGLVAADLQNDGKAEIVGGWGEQVWVLGSDGKPLAGWPQLVSDENNPYGRFSSAVVGDINGDGRKDVVVATTYPRVFAWNADGTRLPGWPREFSNAVQISLADVDRNGVLDVVANDAVGVHVMSGSGANLPGWPVSLPEVYGPVTVADLTFDGSNELIVSAGSTPNKLFVLNSTGGRLNGWPQTLVNEGSDQPGAKPVVGDMDDDGKLEIVAVGASYLDPASSRVFVFKSSGQQLSSWSPNAVRVGSPVLADVDGDGSLEVLASTVQNGGTGVLNVWNRNGVNLPGWPKTAPTGQDSRRLTFSAPIVADIDGDARSEVIVARESELGSYEQASTFGFPIQVYRHDGAALTNLARPAYDAWLPPTGSSPVLAEIDADGKQELLWLSIGRGTSNQGYTARPRIYAWDLDAATNRAQSWTSRRADARSSGVAQAVVPAVRLTQPNTVRRVSGTSRFVFKSGAGGVLQLRPPQGAAVQYAVGSNLLKFTTLGWGEQVSIPANQDVKLRIVTTSAVDVTINWW